MSRRVIIALLAAGLGVWQAAAAPQRPPARTPDIHFTPTHHEVVEAMLTLAAVTRDDVVYDLGAGDGRIAIIAAQQFGARAVGVELDPRLVALARQNARDAGVEARVRFIEGDLFDTPLDAATVVTLYLSTSILRRLEPRLRHDTAPGTRIVSHQFLIGRWAPERHVRHQGADLYLWRTPPRAALPPPIAGAAPPVPPSAAGAPGPRAR